MNKKILAKIDRFRRSPSRVSIVCRSTETVCLLRPSGGVCRTVSETERTCRILLCDVAAALFGIHLFAFLCKK